ncbi:MAG TPA: hypothetical protein VIK39_20370 [Candidatus Angelobacter sp.]
MTKNELLQQIWHTYDGENGHRPSSTREAVDKAIDEGLLEEPRIDPREILAAQMAAALREEIQTDVKGRRYRVNHAVRVTKGGVQHTFWANMGFAPHDHMERAFAQRREQVIGDLVQLKTDVDVYNDLNKGKRPEIQLILDFADDVAEREILMLPKKKAGKVEAA